MSRNLSLPAAVAAAGGIDAWNSSRSEVNTLRKMLDGACQATTAEEALAEVKAFMSLGHNLFSYAYMRMLYYKQPDVYYAALLAEPTTLLPVVYTPTVGEACQKFGKFPMYPRGCYVALKDRGNVQKVLMEYADAMLEKDADGKPMCDCIVFSDGGRILGLGDLASWGMGIPIGKLDLYTVCAGVNPNRTIPVIIDAGCGDKSKNTDHVRVRGSITYTGMLQDRDLEQSAAGTLVNKVYYGAGNFIEEFMQAAVDVFGKKVLLQFEDFNSNDAFPLLDTYRTKFLSYNDDIQGTASVCVAGILGAIKLQKPNITNLREELKQEIFLFHGAGSANIGAMQLLHNEVGVQKSQIFVTNSRGVIWKSADGSDGSFRNDEQKEFAMVGKPDFDPKDLANIIRQLKASCLVGAVGRDPGCFTKTVVEAMVETTKPRRPIIFALSNPMTQAEITAKDCYEWSGGVAIYGSGTKFENVEVAGETRSPGQVNNVYIFPGTSMGAIQCQATSIPDSFFLAAAEAVANSLDAADMKADRVVPNANRIRQVGLNVATAIVLEAQKLGLAQKNLGSNADEVSAAIRGLMWAPPGSEALAEKALVGEERATSAEANLEGIRAEAVRIAMTLNIDADVTDSLEEKEKPVRALKVVIDKKRPRYIQESTVAGSGSLQADFEAIKALVDAEEACGILIRAHDEAGSVPGVDWIFAVWSPMTSNGRQMQIWEGAPQCFQGHFPDKKIVEWRVPSTDKVTFEECLAAVKKG